MDKPIKIIKTIETGGRSNNLRNHELDQQGIWFDYTGFRYKDQYDIQLHDGTIHEHYRPNGDNWYPNLSGKVFNDTGVKRIRLKLDSELNSEHYSLGQERIDHQLHLFGKKY